MTNEMIHEMLKELKSPDPINIADIPNIDLYMDQLTTFMEGKLRDFKRNDEDKIITKTMINNYTKSKVLPASNKKKYSMEQITMLIMIYHMKPILSLNDINIMLKNSAHLSPMDFYESFIKLQNNNKESLEANLADKISQAKEIAATCHDDDTVVDEKTVSLLLALSLVLEANTNKWIAEKIIDSVFSSQGR